MLHKNQNTNKTHCKYGHPLEGDNLRIRKEGYRNCKKCQDFRNYERRIRNGQPKDRYVNIRALFEASKHQTLFGQDT